VLVRGVPRGGCAVCRPSTVTGRRKPNEDGGIDWAAGMLADSALTRHFSMPEPRERSRFLRLPVVLVSGGNRCRRATRPSAAAFSCGASRR
jgi:hypothetical protein